MELIGQSLGIRTDSDRDRHLFTVQRSENVRCACAVPTELFSREIISRKQVSRSKLTDDRFGITDNAIGQTVCTHLYDLDILCGDRSASLHSIHDADNIRFSVGYSIDKRCRAEGDNKCQDDTHDTDNGSSMVGSASYEAHSFTTTTSGGKVTRTCSKCGYTESEDQIYTISYNANGGSGAPASQTKTHGVTLTLSSVKPTRSGYTFMGWATSSTATSASYSAGGSYTANASRTLYAVWQCSHISYDIRYTTSCDWERVCSNCGLVLATGTTHGPYNYSGWIYSNELSHSRVKSCQYGDFSEIEFGSHSTTVKFESVSATQHKYYDFCADCNHIIGTESLEPHTIVSRTENGRIYYECSLCGYSYSEAVTYTISYNANGGEGEPAAQVKIHGATLTLSSTIPTREGYDFLGWATSASATSASYSAGASYTGNANATLYAVWQRSVYTVTYNANGGNGAPSAQTKYYGGTVTIPSTVPTRTNHVFKGWASSATATDIEYHPGDNYTDDASITLYAVWVERNYDFSVSDLAVEPSEVRQYGTATIRFRADNWDRNLPYDNIPVEVLLNGSVILSKTVNFTAYGVQNIVFDLNVGALEGTQTLEARINWADHASETRTGNNSVMTTFNVIKVAETSTEIIDMHGDYVEGREVVTSFYVNNEGSSDILPNDHVSFDFRVYKMDGTNEVTVFEQTWNDVVIPATGRNLVYFKWKIPDGSAGTTLFYKGTINAADASREENADNNAQESSVMVKRQIVSQTPNTRYEDKAPAGYTGNVAAPAHERGKATWNMWVYEGGSLVLKNYGIQVLTGNPVISPSSGCMSKYFVSTFLVARTPTVCLTGERNRTFKFKRGIVLLKGEYIFCHPSIEPHSNTGDKMCAAALYKTFDYLKLSFSEFKICFIFLRLNKRHLFRTITCERNNHIYTPNHNR